MSDDVIKLVPNKICLEEDLAELDFCLEAATPLSYEKYHLLSLLYPILESDNVHQKYKTKVIKMLFKHGDALRVMLRYGKKEISNILYEAEAKVRNMG